MMRKKRLLFTAILPFAIATSVSYAASGDTWDTTTTTAENTVTDTGMPASSEISADIVTPGSSDAGTGETDNQGDTGATWSSWTLNAPGSNSENGIGSSGDEENEDTNSGDEEDSWSDMGPSDVSSGSIGGASSLPAAGGPIVGEGVGTWTSTGNATIPPVTNVVVPTVNAAENGNVSGASTGTSMETWSTGSTIMPRVPVEDTGSWLISGYSGSTATSSLVPSAESGSTSSSDTGSTTSGAITSGWSETGGASTSTGTVVLPSPVEWTTTSTGETSVTSSWADTEADQASAMLESLIDEEYSKVDEVNYQLSTDIASLQLDAEMRALAIDKDPSVSDADKLTQEQSILWEADAKIEGLREDAEQEILGIRNSYKAARGNLFTTQWHRTHPVRTPDGTASPQLP